MRHPRWILALVFASAMSATVAAVYMQGKGGSDDFGPYTPVRDWLKPVRPGYFERGAGVFVESPSRIIYTTDHEFAELKSNGDEAPPTRSGPPSSDTHYIMILDADGKLIEEWSQWNELLKGGCPHAVQISPYDPERSVWIVDRDNSQIFKFSHDGKKLLMTLGEKGVIANDDTHFGRPADISFAPDGSFYVADGYANTRVIKFDKNGKRLLTWGTPGSGPGQFKVEVHDVAVDPQGRIFVADRGNNRIQIFDANGRYLDQWPNITNPSFIYLTKDGYVWVVSGQANRILKYDMGGHLLTYWGTQGTSPGQFDDSHNLSVDAAGNLYVSIYSDSKVGLEKFVPKPNADRNRLVSLGFNRSPPATVTTAMTTP